MTEAKASQARMVAQGSQLWVLQRLFLRLVLRGRPRTGSARARTGLGGRLSVMLVVYGLVGGVAILFSGLGPFELSASLHAMTFVMVGMTLASSSGALLFNAEEADILLHRPVVPRVLLAAKVSVLIVIALVLALALNLTGFGLGIFGRNGTWLYLPVHALTLALEVTFAASMVTLAYGLCLRWFGREKLDNFITTAQVIVAVGAMVGGQLVPRLLKDVDPTQMKSALHWLVLLPPAWFGGLDAVLTGRDVSTTMVVLAGLAVGMTLAAGWLALGRLAGAYGDGLLALNEAGPGAVKTAGRHGRWIGRILALAPIRYWLRDPVERAAFQLTAAGLFRARDVKLRVYPQLAQLAVYPLIFLVGTSSRRHGDPGAFSALSIAFVGAMSSTMIFNSLEMLRFSDHWRGAEIFRLAPLGSPARLFHGARKAVVLLLCGPVAVAMTCLILAWKGFQDGALLLLPGFIAMPIFALLPGVWHPVVPFSEPPEQIRNFTDGLLRALVVIVSAGVIAGLTWLASWGGWLMWFIAAEAVTVTVLAWVLRRFVDGRPWSVEDA